MEENQETTIAPVEPAATAAPEKTVAPAPNPTAKIFGYRPPTWSKDFDYIRNNKGTGAADKTETWLLVFLDRILKKHSK